MGFSGNERVSSSIIMPLHHSVVHRNNNMIWSLNASTVTESDDNPANEFLDEFIPHFQGWSPDVAF